MSFMVRLSCLLLALLCLFLVPADGQGSVSLGGFVPVGTFSRRGRYGDREFISSVGNAKVAIYRKEQSRPRFIPYPIGPVPRYPPVRQYPSSPVRRPPPPKRASSAASAAASASASAVSGRNGLLGSGLLGGLLG